MACWSSSYSEMASIAVWPQLPRFIFNSMLQRGIFITEISKIMFSSSVALPKLWITCWSQHFFLVKLVSAISMPHRPLRSSVQFCEIFYCFQKAFSCLFSFGYCHIEKMKQFPPAHWPQVFSPSSLKTGSLMDGLIPLDCRRRLPEMHNYIPRMVFCMFSLAYWLGVE